MIKRQMKKTSIIFLILLLIEGCGYAPMYSKNQKVDFYIQSIAFDDGDRDLANFIKANLNNYFSKNTGESFIINAKIQYQKTAVSKTAEAVTEEYNLTSTISFQVKSGNVNKLINITETSKIDNFNDEFEEREYELTTKRGMARSITSKLIMQLARINVN